MKIINFILLGILTINVSCGLEDAGKSECAINFENFLDQTEDDYQELMVQPDSQGNDQSLENCLNRRFFTQDYLVKLQQTAIDIRSNGGCSEEEKEDLIVRVGDRIQDLEEDMESTWNRCEKVFGGD